MTLKMLKTHNLTFCAANRTLIANISLQFNMGTIYGILGPNGSGKTTLLKNLAGIWKPSEGQIFWSDQPLLQLQRKEISRILSLVPQNPAIPFDFSVLEMVSMGRYAHSRGSHQSKIETALHQVDGWHLRHQPISHLSGGERQRIYIARALATEAPILLLDEPTAHLDLRHQLEIWQLLRDLAMQNRLIIVTAHDLNATKRYCDEVVILQKGSCIASGKYEEIMNKELLKSVFGVQSVANRFEICN